MIFYESGQRLKNTLTCMQKIFGERQLAVGRELTKKFEEIIRGNFSSILNRIQKETIKGEFVAVVEGAERKKIIPKKSTFKLLTRGFNSEKNWSEQTIVSLEKRIIKAFSRQANVNVLSPDSEIVLYYDHQLLLTKKLATIPRSNFEARKPTRRPFFAPVSLHPRLARCLVNLAGTRESAIVLDPFCGTGGLLLEAGLMGMTIIGSDIDPRMVNGTKTNLEHLGIKNYMLINSNVTELIEHLRTSSLNPEVIITEPPYGRASTTQGEPLAQLFLKLSQIFYEILPPSGRLVISIPDIKLARFKPEHFKLKNKFEVRVHRSLTKIILVLERCNKNSK